MQLALSSYTLLPGVQPLSQHSNLFDHKALQHTHHNQSVGMLSYLEHVSSKCSVLPCHLARTEMLLQSSSGVCHQTYPHEQISIHVSAD